MADFVSDSFTDTSNTVLSSHTGETGATWTQHPAFTADVWRITNANRSRPANGVGGYYASGTAASAECDITWDLYTVTDTGFIGVFARFDLDNPATAGYHMRYLSGGSDKWSLIEIVEGTWTEIGSYPEAISNGVTKSVLFECRNAYKRVWVDGVLRIDRPNNSVTQVGYVGVRGSNNADDHTTGVHLDNFVATDVGGGGAKYPSSLLLCGVGF